MLVHIPSNKLFLGNIELTASLDNLRRPCKPYGGSRRIHPIKPTRIADHPDWLFELKHDGYRAVAYIENGEYKLESREENMFKGFQ